MFLPDPAPGGVFIPRRTNTALLGPAEHDAVLRARTDASRISWEGAPASPLAGRLHRLAGRLGRTAGVSPLADPRLERLRLFACMMRRGDARAGLAAETLLRDGFSERALREAVSLALG